MTERRTDERIQHSGTGMGVKRRGLLAGAAALVAGIAMKQMAQPVAAITGGSTGGALILGANSVDPGGTDNTADRTTRLFNTSAGRITGVPYTVNDAFVAVASPGGIGVTGVSNGSGKGVYGEVLSGNGSGIIGTSAGGDGVQGYGGGTFSGVAGWGGPSGGIGVIGFGANNNQAVNADGVVGFGTGGYSGLVGHGGNNGGAGVYGFGGAKGSASATGAGVVGLANGAPNPGAGQNMGVYGGGGASGFGVYGTSAGGPGVFGTTTASQNAGLAGLVSTPGTAAFAGTSTIPTAFAGFFTGDVFVNGNFTVLDPTKKHGAIAHPDGSYRLLYSMESPESWLEDFGKGQVVGGKATVTLDPDFAAVAHTEDYHVFLTEYGETNGLYVSTQSASGFTVQERGKGAANATFSWRVVAKPKTTNKAARLAKFAIPDIKVPGAGEASLPPAPEGPPQAVPSPRPAPTTAPPAAAPAQGSGTTQGSTTSPVQPAPPPRP